LLQGDALDLAAARDGVPHPGAVAKAVVGEAPLGARAVGRLAGCD
jgi:hypothetical protein